MAERKQLATLTSLRFLAAFWVILHHWGSPQSQNWPGIFKNLAANGAAGVTFFFILSGFILSYTYFGKEANPVNKGKFFWARFSRIYPMYAVSIIIAAPLAFVTSAKLFGAGLSGEFFAKSLSLSTMTHAWFPMHVYKLPWNTPSWSLSVEAFFYLTFPFLGAWLYRQKGLVVGIVSGLCLASSIGLIAWYAVTLPDGNAIKTEGLSGAFYNNLVAFFPPLRLPEFLLGIGLFKAYEAIRDGGLASKFSAFTATGLATFFVGAVTPHGGLMTALSNFLIMIGISIAILGFALISWPRFETTMANRTLLLLGEASFSMYIIHRPVQFYLDSILKRLGFPMIETNLFVAAFAFLVVIGFSILCFKKIEIPARDWLRSRQPKWLARWK